MQVKGRMLALALISFSPAVALFVFATLKQREAAIADYDRELLNFASVSAVEYSHWVEDSRDILESLAEFPEVSQGGGECSQRLAAVRTHLEQYTTASLIGLDGYLKCGGLAVGGSLYLGDRAYFRRTVSTNRFSVGDYAIGRITGKPTVGMAHPITGEDGNVEAVLAVALDLDALGNAAMRMNLPNAATFTVIDPAGNVMVRVGEASVGEGADTVGSRANAEYLELITGADADETVVGSDLDGVQRRLAVRPLRGAASGTQGYIVAGGNDGEMMAQVNALAMTELTLLLLGLLLVGGTTYLMSRKI